MVLAYKLVRDRIPDIMAAQDVEPRTAKADEALSFLLLKEKLKEEVAGLFQALEEGRYTFSEADAYEGFADVYEILEELVIFLCLEPDKIALARRHKCQDLGGFKGRTILFQEKHDSKD